MKNKSKTHLSTVAMAIFVRLLLVLHTILATWRVTLAWNDLHYWLMSLGVLLVGLEGYITIRVNKGIEWKWLCPCFAIYLIITLPSIWLLEISQMKKYMESQTRIATIANVTLTPSGVQSVTSVVTSSLTTASTVISSTRISNETVTMATTTSNNSDIMNVTMSAVTSHTLGTMNTSMTTTPLPVNVTELLTSTVSMTTTTPGGIIANIESLLDSFTADTWVVIVEESLVYLIVIGRWLLPRGRVTREELADLLFDYLAMASDIMELFALFDEDLIRGNTMITYAILVIWSVSFIQFIPVVMNRRAVHSVRDYTNTKDRRNKSNSYVCACCGDQFPDIFVTFAGLFLQDGPFLALRLFIIFYLQLLTYSLVFFVLKNIIVVLLLTYRLGILCFNLPCCSRKHSADECKEVEDEISHFGSTDAMLKKKGSHASKTGIINSNFQDPTGLAEGFYHDGKKRKNERSENGHGRNATNGEYHVSGHPLNGNGIRRGNLPLNIRSINNSGYPVRGRNFVITEPRSKPAATNHHFIRPKSIANIPTPIQYASYGIRRSFINESKANVRHYGVHTRSLGDLRENRVRERSKDLSPNGIKSPIKNSIPAVNSESIGKENEPESNRLRSVVRIGYGDDEEVRGVKL